MTANFADYPIPILGEAPPNIEVGHVVTPSPFTEYGIKGGGDGGRLGVLPALASAIEDALKPVGVTIDTLPITPMRIRDMIRAAHQRAPTRISGQVQGGAVGPRRPRRTSSMSSRKARTGTNPHRQGARR